MRKISLLLRTKLALAAVAAAVVGSVSYAFAASLNVSSASLGAGNASVSACESSTTTSYSSTYDATVSGHYRVTDVHLTLGGTCAAGYLVSATLEGGSPLPITLGTYTITSADVTAGSADIQVPSADGVPAQNVTGVSVAISS